MRQAKSMISRSVRHAVVLAALAGAVLAAATPAASAQQQRFWLGADGAPLPFRSDAEIKDFLLDADIIAREPIGIGVTDPWRLTLERDGVRVDAVFRYFEKSYARSVLADGRLYVNFTDSFRFEAAAYEIARLLGMDNVPPAVARRIGSRSGTLQIWVYHALMESQRVEQRLAPPDRLRWERQRQQMLLFDALIGNTDRNAGNVLVDGLWNMWLIDHTRAFYARARSDRLEEVVFVAREMWDALQKLERRSLEQQLDGLLSGARVAQLLDRRDRLVEHIGALIAARGADAVLY